MRLTGIYCFSGTPLRIARKAILQILLLATIVSMSSSSCCHGKEQVDKDLLKQVAQIELNITGKAAEHENLEDRLSSIETKLFGKEQPGSAYDRLENIRKNLAAASGQNKNAGGQNGDDWPAIPVTTPSNATFPAASAAGSASAAVTTSSTATAPGLTPTTSPSDKATTDSESSPKILVTPPSVAVPINNNATAVSEMAGEEWPTELSHITNTSNEKRGPLKVEVSESASADQVIVNSLKKAPEKEVDQQATKAFIAGHYGLSAKLFDMLSGRKPRDPRYFYGSGQSYKMLGDYPTAFACLIMSWHLGNSPFYDTAVSSLIPILQKTVDDTFKVTYGYSANEPEGVLNAGVRMWKAGMTAQSIKLFEYVLKNDPLYRGAAAYDLGAVAEHDNNPKLAIEYYKWALKENNHLTAAAEKSPELSGAINKSLSLIPPGYIESATADLQQRVLRGDVSWNGWTQGVIHPEHWCSEVCPLCAISRTSLKYLGGQMTLK